MSEDSHREGAGVERSKPTHLGHVITSNELVEMVATILRLTGDDIQGRACAIAAGWPLGVGPTAADDREARRKLNLLWMAGGEGKGRDHG